MTPALYTVAVRELCEFTAKHGDLDLRFTPAPTAQEGMAGHAVAAARRGAGYRSEVSLRSRPRPSAIASCRRARSPSVVRAVSATTSSRRGPVKPIVSVTTTHSAGSLSWLTPVTVIAVGQYDPTADIDEAVRERDLEPRTRRDLDDLTLILDI